MAISSWPMVFVANFCYSVLKRVHEVQCRGGSPVTRHDRSPNGGRQASEHIIRFTKDLLLVHSFLEVIS